MHLIPLEESVIRKGVRITVLLKNSLNFELNFKLVRV